MAALRSQSIFSLKRVVRANGPSRRSLHLTGAASNPPKLSPVARTEDGTHQSTSPVVTPPSRHFNTSRSLKAVKDSSTMDFAYLPDVSSFTAEPEAIRVPLLPETFTTRHPEPYAEHVDSVMRPEILTVSANGTHIAAPSAMYEVVDNNALSIDPYSLPDTVSAAASRLAALPAKVLDREPGVFSQLLNSVVDDLFGKKTLQRA